MKYILIIFILLLAIASSGYASSCISCHSNKDKMTELGYPQFYITLSNVVGQSGMVGARCVDCHLGNSSSYDIASAHKGILSVEVIGKKGLLPLKNRTGVLPSLEPTGKKLTGLIKASGKNGKKVAYILWGDRNKTTGAPAVGNIQKTCGKCHPTQVNNYFKSMMGNVTLQSSHTLFTVNPQNCGPWFSENSYHAKVKELSANFSQKQNAVLNRVCQRCHASCLDCHYTPFEGKGVHKFEKKPDSLSCYGGGRGGSRLCHTGPEEFRRGAGYIRGDFSKPEGLPEDVHYKAGIICIECHPSSHHDFSRFGSLTGSSKVDNSGENICENCHSEIAKESQTGIHKSVACEACHIPVVGGYQVSTWGPGHVGGLMSPMRPNKAFIGKTVPLIIKTPENYWIPVKAFAQATLNIKKNVTPTDGLVFRKRTRDAYAIIGMVNNLPSNNKSMMWVDVEKDSHGINGVRKCESCHTTTGQQKRLTTWSFNMAPFVTQALKGEVTTVANGSGIYIYGIKNTSAFHLKKGAKIVDFFPWYYEKNYVYHIPGNFTIPKVSSEEMQKYKAMLAEINNVSNAVSYAKAKGIDVSSEEKAIENARKVGIHNIAYTTKELGSIKNSLREKEKPEAPPKPREICGPTLIALLAAVPLVLRRRIRI